MIIIAESGSTKTNWLTEDKQLFETIGFNPMFHSSESILQELNKQQALSSIRDTCSKIYFYGAGCSSDERKKTVTDALSKYFTKAELIKTDHDMNAAAFATYNG